MKFRFVAFGELGLDWRIVDYNDDRSDPVKKKWSEVYSKIGGEYGRPHPETNLRVLAWWCKNLNK